MSKPLRAQPPLRSAGEELAATVLSIALVLRRAGRLSSITHIPWWRTVLRLPEGLPPSAVPRARNVKTATRTAPSALSAGEELAATVLSIALVLRRAGRLSSITHIPWWCTVL
jgi:hypothetical protein